MVKRREKGVVSRLIRQTSCLFIEIPPRSLQTEFKCHLRLSNGHRAGGDPSKRLGDKRPLLNMAGTAGKARRPASPQKSAPRWRAREKPEPLLQRDEARRPRLRPRLGGPGRGWRLRVGTPGKWGPVVIQLLSCRPQHGRASPSPETRRERLVRFPLTSFCPLPSGVCKSELQSY